MGVDEAVEPFVLAEFYAETKYMKHITLKQLWMK